MGKILKKATFFKCLVILVAASAFAICQEASADWLQASGGATQTITTMPEPAIIDQVDGASGFTVEDDICATAAVAGDYLVVHAPQFGTVCGSKPGYATAWLRINGVDVPNSNVLKNIGPTVTDDVIVSQGIVYLEAGDCLEFMVAGSNDSGCQALEAISVEGQPLVPSVIVSILPAN
jgi:hypothetical protein